jgi:uncharacterized protein (DUF2252 family)
VDVVGQIHHFNEGRSPDGLALKYGRMRGDAFAFLRGSCHLFNARLSLSGALRKAPAVWACGDLHAENFGCYKGAQRQLCFDIVDFDEGLLAPAPWDALHLLASLDLGLPLDAPKADLAQAFVDAYGAALAEGKAGWVDATTAQPPVLTLLEKAGERQRPAFLDTRTARIGRRRRIRLDNGKAWPASAAQQEAVRATLAAFAAGQADPRFFEVIDIARRIAGTGSLGLERYIVLVRGKGSPDGNHLLDLKLAVAASGASRVPQLQPAWADEAQRVVGLQQRMQAVSVAFLHALPIRGRPFVLRALQPSEDRIVLKSPRPAAEWGQLVGTMARCLAWSQLRGSGRGGSATADELMDFASRPKWRARLIEQADAAAAQTRADWKCFCDACDAGAFAAG